jgi:signal transduction histidine kinase
VIVDANRPSRIAVAFALANGALFAFLALTQWIAWGGVVALTTFAPDGGLLVVDLLQVVIANTGFSCLLVVAFFALRPAPRRWAARIALAATLAGCLGVPRIWMLRRVPAAVHGWGYDIVDWAAGVVGGVVLLCGALLVHDLVGDVRREERRRRQHVIDTASALSRLEAEEAARRHELADRLHGQVQNRLVLAAVGLKHTAGQLEDLAPDAAAELHR